MDGTLLGLLVVVMAQAEAAAAEPEVKVQVARAEEAEPEEEIVVTATRARVPQSETGAIVDVVEPEWGERSVEAALRDLPEAFFAADGLTGQLTQLRTRGCESDHTLVAIDGHQINDIGGGFDFAHLGLAGVERIELMRGAGSALYGSDAMAGVLNVLLRTGERPFEMNAFFEGGTEGSTRERTFIGGKSEDWAYGVTVEKFDRFGDVEYDNSDYHLAALTGKFSRSDLILGDLDVVVNHSSTIGGLYVPATGLAGAGAEDPNDRLAGDTSLVGLRWKSVKAGPFSLSLSGSRWDQNYSTMTRVDGVDAWDSNSDLTWDVERTAVDLRGEWALERVKIWAGADYEFEAGARSYVAGASSNYVAEDRNNGAGYVQARFEWEDLKLDCGGRYELNEYFGQAPTGFLTASWQAQDDVRLHGTLSGGIKEPSFLESHTPYTVGLPDYVGNPDLEPERSLSCDVGVDWSPNRKLKLDVTYFHIDITDMIVFTDTGLGYYSWLNRNKAMAQGVELTCKAELQKGLSLKVAGGWLDARAVDDGGEPSASFETGIRLLRRPDWSASGGVEWRPVEEFAAYVEARGYGERYDGDWSTWPATRVTLDPYVVCNLAFEWSFADNWQLTGRWENVGNARYEEVFGNPAPGSRVFLGVNYSRRY